MSLAHIIQDLQNQPIKFAKILWPDVIFYKDQRLIIESVRDNSETYVVAGNQLGKDYVTGFICLHFFLTRWTVRVVTTSVKDDHLRILWGEIGRFIRSSKYPLTWKEGGPLIWTHRELRKFHNKYMCDISYCRGLVSEKGEGMAGHHADYTLGVCDEASGIDDEIKVQMDGWAKRFLAIGNPNACENFFKKAVKAGDLIANEIPSNNPVPG